VIGGQSRPEALVAQEAKIFPRWSSRIAFQYIVPLLCVAGHVERRQPDLVNLTGELTAKEGFASVEPAQGILLAVVEWKRQFVELGHAMTFSALFWMVWCV
jgi:hypothetical protein